jgi:hypothetical protein
MVWNVVPDVSAASLIGSTSWDGLDRVVRFDRMAEYRDGDHGEVVNDAVA